MVSSGSQVQQTCFRQGSEVLLVNFSVSINYHTTYPLTCNRQTEQYCPIKCESCLSRKENTFLQWAFILNSAPAPVENWHLEGCMLTVNMPHR